MDRRDAFEKSWAARHRVSVEEIREHRFETEDGYDLPALAAHYRTWCLAIESVVVELPYLRGYPIQEASSDIDWYMDEGKHEMKLLCRDAIQAAGIKVAP